MPASEDISYSVGSLVRFRNEQDVHGVVLQVEPYRLRIKWDNRESDRWTHILNVEPYGDLAHVPALRTGIYRHYKGPLYEVSGYAHDANDADRLLVLYRGLELTDIKHIGPRWCVRDAFAGDDPFFSKVVVDATQSSVPLDRFTYLGPVLTADMMP